MTVLDFLTRLWYYLTMTTTSFRPARKPMDARTIFSEVVSDDDFDKNKEQLRSPHRAFAITAHALVDLGSSESGYRSTHVDRLHVAATVDDYVGAKTALREEYGLSREEKIAFKRKAIVFNHALEAMIDNDRAAGFSEVKNYLMGLYRMLHPRESPQQYDQVCSYFCEDIKGMTHEIIAEQLAGYLGYDVEPTTVNDELKGADRFFGIGDKWVPIDIKASTYMANKARNDDRNGRMIVATNVPNDIIGCSFFLPPQAVPTYAAAFQREIDADWCRVQDLKRRKKAR